MLQKTEQSNDREINLSYDLINMLNTARLVFSLALLHCLYFKLHLKRLDLCLIIS